MRARTTLFLITMAVVFIWRLPVAELAVVESSASPFHYTGDGQLFITDSQTSESISILYRTPNGYYEDAALEAIDHTLRCHGKGEKFPISLKLIELIDHIQDYFRVNTAMVVSGYRSPEYNAALRKRQRNVAHDSLHMQGLAMDIQFPGITKKELASYARSLKIGGVGDYARSNFVHIDVGPIRNW